MREYGKISPLFWTGETGKQIVKSGPECVVVAMHLLTSPHANALGHYYIPLVFISHETGIPYEGVRKAFDRVCELCFCTYDTHTEVIWVYEMAREQIGQGLKENDNRCKWVKEQYKLLPKSPFLLELYV